MNVTLRTIGDQDGSRFYALTIEHEGRVELRAVATADAEKAVPPGVYQMRPDDTGKHRWWVLLGGPLGLAGSGAPREQIEFHVGNWGLRDSDGCLIPGSAIRWMQVPEELEWFFGVSDSVATLAKMRTVLGRDVHRCEVI